MEFVPSYQELKTRFPLSFSGLSFIEESRQTIRSILNGTDPRLLLIVGPCSIHDLLSAKEFASYLCELQKSVSNQFLLVMRVYCEKPRTASGWKGFLFDPLLDGSYAMNLGIEWTRQLLLELTHMRVPTATEFLDPLTAFYYDDLISWGSIGARTSSSQIHRHLASDLCMPIGFKNGLAGNISPAVHGALAASYSQTYLRVNENGKTVIWQTKGNPDTHIVLRGGDSSPNYGPDSVSKAISKLEQAKIAPKILIDCSHQNCNKQYLRQIDVFQSVLHQITEGNSNIRGLMLESHLFAGQQPLNHHLGGLQYGVSITDACLDWSSTSRLIEWGAEYLQKQLFINQNCVL